MIYNIKLTKQEAQLVGQALAELPLKVSFNAFASVNQQVIEQEQAAAQAQAEADAVAAAAAAQAEAEEAASDAPVADTEK